MVQGGVPGEEMGRETEGTPELVDFSYACHSIEGGPGQPHTSSNVRELQKVFKDNKTNREMMHVSPSGKAKCGTKKEVELRVF